MNAKTALWLPVLLGGATGVLLALAGAPKKLEMPTASSTPTVGVSSSPSSVATAEAPALSARPSEASPSSLAPSAPAPSAPAPSAAAPGNPPVVRAPAIDSTPPATREELVEVEVRCDRKSPEECERAARALEAGKLVPRDPGRASVLRRIALTLYVKQCESGRALACARLSEMYASGEYVQPNPRGAEALRARVGELCAQRPGQPGCAP